MGDALSLRPRPEAATQMGRKRIDERTVVALRRHAPLILELHPDAAWSPQLEELVVSESIGPNAHSADARRVRHAVARVLARGRHLGRWNHVGTAPLKSPLPRVDRLTSVRRTDVEASEARRARLLKRLDTILSCKDGRVLLGALIIAAADISAVLVEELLEQLPGLFQQRSSPVSVAGGLAWVDLALAPASCAQGRRAWKNVRRWILDDVSLRICAAILQLGDLPATSSARCVAACMRHLNLAEITLPMLCSSSRAWWSLHLDESMYRYATTIVMAPSLPENAFHALVSGERRRPLRGGAAPDSRDEYLGNDLNRPTPPLAHVQLTPLTETSFEPHRIAICELKRVFSPFVSPGSRRPSLSQLVKRLETWNARHRSLGGWVVLMADWVRAALDRRYLPATAKPAQFKSLHRYLTGFARPFLSRLYHLSPDQLLEATADETGILDAFADGFEQLRQQLEGRGGASTDREGLRQFLSFVRAVGGPKIYLGSDWRTVVSACDADANILTEHEFQRVLAQLSDRGPADSYPVARARAMTILAYRLGLRWGELQTRRLADLRVRNGHATLWVRANPYFKGKTRSSRRKIPVELFLTTEELAEVAAFVRQAAKLTEDRPQGDMLFADLFALHRPPDPGMTHDWILDAMRHQSGDPTIVFHHLRHSAATQLYGRLIVDAPGDWRIHDWSVPSARWFTEESGAYASRVTGRRANDGARLVAVSRLLGHIDPTTSMRHYIHVADLALAAHVRHHYVIPTGVVARADGIQRGSVYRARSRSRKRVRPEGC